MLKLKYNNSSLFFKQMYFLNWTYDTAIVSCCVEQIVRVQQGFSCFRIPQDTYGKKS